MATITSRLAQAVFLLLIAVLFCGAPAPAETWTRPPKIPRVNRLIDIDPSLISPPTFELVPDDPIPIWRDALSRADALLQRITIDTLVRAHRRGMKGVDVFVPQLVELLQNESLDVQVRRAAVRALIALDATEHAKLLADQSRRYGAPIASVVDEALPVWDADELAEDWLRRLQDPLLDTRGTINAIRGLAFSSDSRSNAPLKRLLSDRSLPNRIRMESAAALGKLNDAGLLPLAKSYAESGEPYDIGSFVAVRLLSRHEDSDTVTFLTDLALDGEANTAIQAEATRRLLEIDSGLLLKLVDPLLASSDSNVRKNLAKSLILSRQAKYVKPLASLLDDVNPSLRELTADALVDLANNHGLKDEVIARSVDVLQQEAWRGCEQATYVLVNLEHKACSDRLVELIDHPRGETMLAAGWGLRNFALEKHLPAMLRRAESIYAALDARQVKSSRVGPEPLAGQLFSSFGQLRYVEAAPLMKKFIPKRFELGENARSSAVWAMGYLYENQAPEELSDLLLERLNDNGGDFPESDTVRKMAAISLGRMKSEKAIPDLQKFAHPGPGMVSMGCHWSLNLLTGKEMPEFPDHYDVYYRSWFLAPAREKEEEAVDQ